MRILVVVSKCAVHIKEFKKEVIRTTFDYEE